MNGEPRAEHEASMNSKDSAAKSDSSTFGRTTMGKSLSETLMQPNTLSESKVKTQNDEAILTEDQAIYQLPAIPLYFPTSYSLVKPYIQGFEINTLDAPSLKNVRIDINWQPGKTKSES